MWVPVKKKTKKTRLGVSLDSVGGLETNDTVWVISTYMKGVSIGGVCVCTTNERTNERKKCWVDQDEPDDRPRRRKTTKDDERRRRGVCKKEVGWFARGILCLTRARTHAFIREVVEDGRTDGRGSREVKKGIWIVNSKARVERERMGAWMTDGDDE